MTPKEKAINLVNEYYTYPIRVKSEGIEIQMDYEDAKRLALISGYEVLKQLTSDWGDNQWRANEYVQYWNEVQNQINLL